MQPPSTVRTRFGGLVVAYDESVLEPRAWTAAQAEWAAVLAEKLPRGPVLELCCGAGQIGLLTSHLTGRDAVLVDVDKAAVRFAEGNARQLRARGQRVEVRRGDLSDVLRDGESFPLVVADPPYIPSDRTTQFPADPLVAIDGGPDGLDVARVCVDVASRHLAAPGLLVLQLRDREQAETIRAEGEGLGLTHGEIRLLERHGALLALRNPSG